MSCEQEFLNRLRAQGLRLTPQREMVLAALHQVEGFASVEEIYTQVQTRSTSLDISTVYRTLELLEELRLVAHIEGQDGQRRYELLGLHGLHYHLQCTRCGQTLAVPPEVLDDLRAHLAQTYGFALAPVTLNFPGLCAACQAKTGTA